MTLVFPSQADLEKSEFTFWGFYLFAYKFAFVRENFHPYYLISEELVSQLCQVLREQ